MNESAQAQLKDEELHLYSRHILLNEWDIDAQQNLKNSHVLIIGAGGLGCTSSEMLVRAGVGKITIIDLKKSVYTAHWVMYRILSLKQCTMIRLTR